jgi:hypothetical protein
MSDKRKRPRGITKLVRGIPGADLDFWMEWLLSSLDKREKLGRIARTQFEVLFEECVVQLLQLVRDSQSMAAKKLAGIALARVYVSLHKHHRKHCEENYAYRRTVKKLWKIRPDVLVPSSPVGQILQKEFRKAELYYRKLHVLLELVNRQPRLWLSDVNTEAVFERIRDQLLLQHFTGVGRTKLKGKALEWRYGALWTEQGLAAIEKQAREATPAFFYPDEITGKRRITWEDSAREWKIAEAYWPLKDFPPLSDATEKQWWDFIWLCINQKQREILPRLHETAKGRAEAKEKPLYLKHFYKQFRKHWLTLVRMRMAGTFA